jgi:hypothetical protein
VDEAVIDEGARRYRLSRATIARLFEAATPSTKGTSDCDHIAICPAIIWRYADESLEDDGREQTELRQFAGVRFCIANPGFESEGSSACRPGDIFACSPQSSYPQRKMRLRASCSAEAQAMRYPRLTATACSGSCETNESTESALVRTLKRNRPRHGEDYPQSTLDTSAGARTWKVGKICTRAIPRACARCNPSPRNSARPA